MGFIAGNASAKLIQLESRFAKAESYINLYKTIQTGWTLGRIGINASGAEFETYTPDADTSIKTKKHSITPKSQIYSDSADIAIKLMMFSGDEIIDFINVGTEPYVMPANVTHFRMCASYTDMRSIANDDKSDVYNHCIIQMYISDYISDQIVRLAKIPMPKNDGYYVMTQTSSVNLGAAVKDSTCCNSICRCMPGDIFTINGKGGYNGRLWAFTDANLNVISRSGGTATADNLIITAPEGAAYIIINDYTGSTSYYGCDVLGRLAALEAAVVASV